jgi:hypothetical protein
VAQEDVLSHEIGMAPRASTQDGQDERDELEHAREDR